MAGDKEPISWQKIYWTPQERKDLEQNAPVVSIKDLIEEKPCYDEQPWLDPKYKTPFRQRFRILWIGLTFLLLATIGAVIGIAFFLSTRGSHTPSASARTFQTDRGAPYGVSVSTNQYTPRIRARDFWADTEAANFKDLFGVMLGDKSNEAVSANTDVGPEWIKGSQKKRGVPWGLGPFDAWSSASVASMSDRQTIGSQDYSNTPGTPPGGFSAVGQPPITNPQSTPALGSSAAVQD